MKNPFAFLFRRPPLPGAPAAPRPDSPSPVTIPSEPRCEPGWDQVFNTALSHLETELEILEHLDASQVEICDVVERALESSSRPLSAAASSQVSVRAAALLIGGQLEFLRRANHVALIAIRDHRPRQAALLAKGGGPYRVAIEARRILRQLLAEHGSE